jgi:hypothetical protein
MLPQGFIDYMSERLTPAQFKDELKHNGIAVDISADRIWTADAAAKFDPSKYVEWECESRDENGNWILDRHVVDRIVRVWNSIRYPAANT